MMPHDIVLTHWIQSPALSGSCQASSALAESHVRGRSKAPSSNSAAHIAQNLWDKITSHMHMMIRSMYKRLILRSVA